jgi:hypothetical protein
VAEPRVAARPVVNIANFEKPKRLGYSQAVDAKQMGRKGGRSRSVAKRAAARRNGVRGGRPSRAELFARRVRETCARLAPEYPQIDPSDLYRIVRLRLLPPVKRCVFIFRRSDGRYVF